MIEFELTDQEKATFKTLLVRVNLRSGRVELLGRRQPSADLEVVKSEPINAKIEFS